LHRSRNTKLIKNPQPCRIAIVKIALKLRSREDTKKAGHEVRPYLFDSSGQRLCLGDGSHVDETTTVLAFSEEDGTVNESVDSVVLAHTHVQTGVVNSATLTFDDVTCFGELTTKDFHAESLAF
jgi:hypothetical protein